MYNIRKLARAFAIIMAAAIMLTSCAFAETMTTEDYEAKIAELEEKIADLEFQLSVRDYVATFDGGNVTVEAAMERYDYVSYMYESYGYSMDGFEDYLKQDIMQTLVQDEIMKFKAAEFGVGVPDEAKEAELREEAKANLEEYVSYYRSNFEDETLSEDEIVANTLSYLEQSGVTEEILYQNVLESYMSDEMFAYVTKDIAITDEDVKAEYDSLIAADTETYGEGGYSYESALMNDTPVYYTPEGYRYVKHILVSFDEDQTTRYDALIADISALNDELTAVTAPDTDVEATTEATTEAETEATEEPEAEPRTAEEIQSDIDAKNAELDALYAELMPTAEEAISQFNEGVPFDDLISIYGEDPGMQSDPGMTNGYPVCANSAYWETTFTEGAMSIANIGEISEPVRGTNGLHIIYYKSDIPAGAKAYEDVAEEIKASLTETKRSEAYDTQIDAWMTELNVTYYLENFR